MLKQNNYSKIVDMNECYSLLKHRLRKVSGFRNNCQKRTKLNNKKLLTYSTLFFFHKQSIHKQLALGKRNLLGNFHG